MPHLDRSENPLPAKMLHNSEIIENPWPWPAWSRISRRAKLTRASNDTTFHGLSRINESLLSESYKKLNTFSTALTIEIYEICQAKKPKYKSQMFHAYFI